MRRQTAAHLAAGVPVQRLSIMAAFGCNFSGDVAQAQVFAAVEDGLSIAAEAGVALTRLGGGAADTLLPALPMEMGEERARPGLLRQPPRMGEHNAEILAEAGFSRAEIEALVDRGILTAAVRS